MPSSLTVIMAQSTMPLNRFGISFPSASLSMPSVCSRTLIRSVGLAMAEAMAPAPPPATIFFQSGMDDFGALGSTPGELRSGPYSP